MAIDFGAIVDTIGDVTDTLDDLGTVTDTVGNLFGDGTFNVSDLQGILDLVQKGTETWNEVDALINGGDGDPRSNAPRVNKPVTPAPPPPTAVNPAPAPTNNNTGLLIAGAAVVLLLAFR